MPKKKIRIAIADEGDSPLFSTLLEFVRDDYEIEFTKDLDAPYVLHSGNGYEVLRYSGVRIFATGKTSPPTSTSATMRSVSIVSPMGTATTGCHFSGSTARPTRC